MNKIKQTLYHLFNDHPTSVGESYLQHFATASKYGFLLLIAGIACLIHSIFPFLFVHTAGNIVKKIHRDITERTNAPIDE